MKRLVWVFILGLLLISCGGSSTYVPKEDIVSSELEDLEVIIDVSGFDVYKFMDGDTVCYVAIRELDTSIDCLD